MKYWTLVLLAVIGLSSLTQSAIGQNHQDDWLPQFLNQLDPNSEVVTEIEKLGADASNEDVIQTAARHFRSRQPLTSLWVIPLDATASEQDIEQADKAIDHIITDRSGEFPLPDKLPWFSAPEKLMTLSRFPHFDYLTRAYASTQDER